VCLNPHVVTSSGHFDLRYFDKFRSHTSVLSPTPTSAHAVTVTFLNMPHKEGLAIGRVSSAATKVSLLRATANPQVTAATLAYPTNRSAASRARETPQETEARLAEQRNGAAASRASETPHETGALAPKNDCVHKLNLQIQNLLPTNSRTYTSVDVVMDPSQALPYPVKFLNLLEPTGIPPRNLQLKVRVPIMLRRNLYPPRVVQQH